LAAALFGCGDGDSTPSAGRPGPQLAGGNGELSYAISDDPGDLDPLAAETVSAQVVARQVFEPLVATLNGPYGQRRGVGGLALSAQHSGDFQVWVLRLRGGVRFQDGMLLNAAAVVANAERWRTTAAGRALLPGLLAADGPRPNLVRFRFSTPSRNLPTRLSDPRLGLVSPAALTPESGVAASLRRSGQAGSGPFQLRSEPDGELVLARNRGWWGTRLSLGPALDRLRFPVRPGASQRLALLREGRVEVAGEISRAEAEVLRGDPLLSAVGEDRYEIGIERSVRGLRSGRPHSLAGVWLAALDSDG
jgi:ABC-type transport system substrate-binding protein